MVNEGDEGVSHGHMVGIGVSDKAYRRLGVNSMVKGRCKARVLKSGIKESISHCIWCIDSGTELDVRKGGMGNGRRHCYWVVGGVIFSEELGMRAAERVFIVLKEFLGSGEL